MKNIKIDLFIILLSAILFLSLSNVFAAGKNIIFFAENFDNVPAKVIDRMERCDKFCLSAPFDSAKYINKNIQRLITSRKIEPVLKISEPYFPLISTKIELSSSTVLDKTEDFESFLQKYKDDYRSFFEKRKHGMYLKGSALNDDILFMFYRYNILWTTAKAENSGTKGVFFKNGVALFISYYDIPNNNAKMRSFFSALPAGYTPVILTEAQVKNELFMLSLINYIEESKTTDAVLPVDAAYYLYGKDSERNVNTVSLQEIPIENVLKLYLADKELKESDKSSEVYQILYDEVANMYSYDVINGISNEDGSSQKLFDISYSNIFRVLNKPLPNMKDYEDILNKNKFLGGNSSGKEACRFTKDYGGIKINNYGDYFANFIVRKNEKSVIFETDVKTGNVDYYDIYIDMNSVAYAGGQKGIKPLNLFFVPEHCWEYAIRVTPESISVYKFVSNNAELIKSFDNNGKLRFSIPADILKGNPFNWSYQVAVVKDGETVDFIETTANKEKIFKSFPLQINMFGYKN